MNDSHNDLLRIRLEIKKYQTFDNMMIEERFQNTTIYTLDHFLYI